jgi:hypothetical protein
VPAQPEADVLIVGAGPTGLMLANQLGRRGVRAQVIDRHAGPARETRALGVQARSAARFRAGRCFLLGVAGLLRTEVLARIAAFAMRRERVQRAAFRVISQTGIRYPESPLSLSLPGLPETAPRAGDRFPWLRLKLRADGPAEDLVQALPDTKFHLLLFGQPAPAEKLPLADALLRVHAIPDDPANEEELSRAHIPRQSFCCGPTGMSACAAPACRRAR